MGCHHIDCCDSQNYHFTTNEYVRMYVSDVPLYEGSAEATPGLEAQTLPTRNTILAEDIEIAAIPYREVANEYGTTVIIGGE